MFQTNTFQLVPPTSMFFARVEIVNEIHDSFCHEKLSIVVLQGMSGVGKSQVARKYAKDYESLYSNIVWFNASFYALYQSKKNICHVLDLETQDRKGKCFSEEVLSQKIHNHFRNEKTLYIYDDVDDARIENLKKQLSYQKNAFTLITTKWGGWSSKWGGWSSNYKTIKIKPFSDEEGVDFLSQNITFSCERNLLQEITNELGNHPFALSQSINYLNITRTSLEEYVKQLKENTIGMISSTLDYETEHLPLKKSINIVLMKLRINAENAALRILKCLSCCDGKDIRRGFLLEIAEELGLHDQVNRAIVVLTNFSIISLENVDNENFLNDHFTLHELTQKISQNTLLIETGEFTLYKNLISRIFKKGLKNYKNNDSSSYWLNHFIFMFWNYTEEMVDEFQHLQHETKDCLYAEGRVREATQILLKIFEKVKNENEAKSMAVIEARDCLSQSKINEGLYNEAIVMLEENNSIMITNLGSRHPSTLTTQHDIARCMMNLGLYNDAFEKFIEIEIIRSEILGNQHPSTLTTQHNIALCQMKMGLYNEAIEKFREIEKIRLETLGNRHSSTLTTQHNIAYCQMEMGLYKDAIEKFREIEAIQFKNLGNRHPSTLTTQHNIAHCLMKMGLYNEAIEKFREIEKIRLETLGNRHPSTLTTQSNIAYCQMEMGLYKDVIEKFREIEKMRLETLGNRHPSTLTTQSNIAYCQMEMGLYKDAIEKFREIEKMRLETLGNLHQSTLTTQRNIVICQIKMGLHKDVI